MGNSADNVDVTQTDTYTDFDQHVSPLDPNMSSVARYSPVYNEQSTEYNPVVIHQLVTQDTNAHSEQFANNLNTASLENMPTVLCNNNLREVNNQYLQMVEENDVNLVTTNNTDGLQLTPENEQEVELLITDEATGNIKNNAYITFNNKFYKNIL